jgi:hypothetical protein
VLGAISLKDLQKRKHKRFPRYDKLLRLQLVPAAGEEIGDGEGD